MYSRKMMRFLLVAVPVLLFLSLHWPFFTPVLSVSIIYLGVLVSRNSELVRRAFGLPPRKPVVYYQPAQQQEDSSPPPNLRPSFNLTAEEYQQLSRQYQQGYQQTPPQSTGWSPFFGSAHNAQKDQLKEDRLADYEG